MIRFKEGKEAEVLAALYNCADGSSIEDQSGDAIALGVLARAAQGDMTVAEAQTHINRGLDFDYLGTRALKLNLSGGDFEEYCYDRENGGPGTATTSAG